MSETTEANVHQNTPSGDDLDARIAADEVARSVPEALEPASEPVEAQSEPEVETAEEEPKVEDEIEKRISRLAYEKRTAEKQARELREQLDRLQGKLPALPKDDELDRLVEQRAAELATVKAYNDKANAIYQAGVKDFPDFETKLGGLRDLGGITPQLVEAADEIGDAHKIIHYLARNLDEAEDIVKMPPHRMGAALSKIATKLAAPKPQSKAPAAIRPVSGRTNGEQSIEDSVRGDGNMGPIDVWMAKEDERWATRRRR